MVLGSEDGVTSNEDFLLDDLELESDYYLSSKDNDEDDEVKIIIMPMLATEEV